MKEKQKVLILRGRSTDPAIGKVAKSLYLHGYEIHLLLWHRYGKLTFVPENESYHVKYFSFRAPQDKTSAVLFYPFWWIYQFLIILYIRPDIIHACDLDTLYPAVIWKFFRHKKFVYHIYDYYANNITIGKFRSLISRIIILVDKIEKFGIGFSDLLILADEIRYEEVKGASIKKIIFLYNTPEDTNNLRSISLKGTNSPIDILYIGIIQYNRGITQIIRAISDLSNVKLTLAGPLVNKEIIADIDKKKIQYIGWIPTYDEVISKTKEADILFRLSDPYHPSTKYASPNKLFEAMMCAKPIIVSDNSSMAVIVRNEKCGIVIPYEDTEAIKKAIICLIDDVDYRERLGNNGRKAYENKYSWTIMEQRLRDAYDSLK